MEKTENSEIRDADHQNGLVDDLPLPDEFDKILMQALGNNKAYTEALHRRKVQLLMKHHIDRQLREGVHDTELYKYSEMLKKEGENKPVRFITLSLSGDNVLECVDYWNKYFQSRKWLPKGTKWVYEQRGDNDQTYLSGLHIHVIMPRTKKKPSEIIRDIHEQTQLAKNFIDIRDRTSDHCEKYLFTEKKPVYKKTRQVYDAKMRSEFKLKSFYTI